MLKRIISTFAASVGLATSAAEPSLVIGDATIVPPSGWRQIKKEEARMVLRSSDGRQQATVSLMRFGAVPSFEDFKRLCALRVGAEKKAASDIFVDPAAPTTFSKDSGYGAFYSGGEKSAGRMFSCYLSLVRNELVTIYVEGIGVASKDHLASFEMFVTGLKRK